MKEEDKKRQPWINDEHPEMFELRILIKLYRSEPTLLPSEHIADDLIIL